MAMAETLMPCPPPLHHSPNPNPKGSSSRSVRRRTRSPSDNEADRSKSRSNSSSSSLVVKFPANNLVMEKVKILKRGEGLKLPNKEDSCIIPETKTKKIPLPMKAQKKSKKIIQDEESKLFSVNRFGPEPDKVPKKINFKESPVIVVDDAFAGSALIASPSPSSLPFPVFFTKKKNTSSSEVYDVLATDSLKRILNINLF